jgi:AcrR family transcriptional regulator
VAVSEQVKARRTRSATRRQELVDAALDVFVSRGVAATSVDDIVQAAGVAKGTFYLYFATRDDIVNAVAERLVTRVADRVAAIANNAGLSPPHRLLALGQLLNEVGKQGNERDLVEAFHRPENRAVHDRLTERIVVQLAPSLAAVIREGIDADLFLPQDPRLSALFVLGTFTSLHHMVSEPGDMPAAIAHLDAFILRGLGYRGDLML